MSTLPLTKFFRVKHSNGSIQITRKPAPELTDLEKAQLMYAIAMIVIDCKVSFDAACNSALYYSDRVAYICRAGMPETRAREVANNRVGTFLGIRL